MDESGLSTDSRTLPGTADSLNPRSIAVTPNFNSLAHWPFLPTTARKIERLHNGRIKVISFTKLHRLFNAHAEWEKAAVFEGYYTRVEFRRGDISRVFYLRPMR